MRIGSLSDLHVDANAYMLQDGESFVILIGEEVQRRQLDLLLIAGDLSNDFRVGLTFLEELRATVSCPVLFVPGNHDYWSKENGETDTWKIYEAFREAPHSLLEQPVLLNEEWAIVGNSGWYDYSFGDPSFQKEDFEKMTFHERTWQDKKYVHWGRSNEEMHTFFLEKLLKDLQQVGHRQVILMTHVVTHPHFIVPTPHELFSYFNAFLGSAAYQEIYQQYPIQISIMGHVHYRQELLANGVHYICSCLGNAKEWRTTDVRKEIADALFTFTL